MTDNSNNKLAVIRNYMRSEGILTRFAEVLGGDRQASAYVSSVVLAVGSNPTLAECSMTSIATSAMRAATLRLSCDPGIGQAYLVPFKGKAILVIGYKGLRDMAIRTEKYRYLNVSKIYEGETVVEDRITGVHHLEGGKRSSKIVGWLFYMELYSGFCKSEYMSCEEIHAHAAKYSKSYSFPDSPWKTSTEQMEKKTSLRLGLLHWGYLDPYDVMAMNTDETPTDDVIDANFVPGETPKSSIGELLNGLGYDDEGNDTEGREEETPPQPETGEVKPRTPEELRAYLIKEAKAGGTPDTKILQETNGCLKYILNSDGARIEFLNWLNGSPVKSSKEMQPGLIVALYQYLDPAYDKNGGAYYSQNGNAQAELTAAHAYALETSGQKSLL